MSLTEPPAEQHPALDRVEEPTGHPGVDSVLESLAGLADRPVSEHVAVYEAAAASLRDALSDAVAPTPA